MALGLLLTAAITAPVEVSSWARTQVSLVPVMDSKPSRVPEPASRPMQAMSPFPPKSSQEVTLPVKMSAICSTVKSSTGHSALTMMAMPSRATVVAIRPFSVSTSFRTREARPMSQVPLATASMPVPEPVAS